MSERKKKLFVGTVESLFREDDSDDDCDDILLNHSIQAVNQNVEESENEQNVAKNQLNDGWNGDLSKYSTQANTIDQNAENNEFDDGNEGL